MAHETISADSHIVEPGDLWLTNIEPAFHDRAPRLVRADDGDVFVCDGNRLAGVNMIGGAGKDPATAKRHARLDEVRRGGWDPQARIKDMDLDGIKGEVLYPSVGLVLYRIEETDFLYACLRAYNTWLAEFCSHHPDRFRGVGMVAPEDPQRAVAELHRIRRLGLHGVMIPVHSTAQGAYLDSENEGFWATAEELGLPVSLHLATHRGMNMANNVANMVTAATRVQQPLAEMIFHGLFDRFPRLRVVSVENDCGWAGHFLERMDRVFVFNRPQFEFATRRRPSEVFREHVSLTFMRDTVGISIREAIGVDNIMWSSDYPHHDSTWPKSQEVISHHFKDVPHGDRRKITHDNAAQLYGFAI